MDRDVLWKERQKVVNMIHATAPWLSQDEKQDLLIDTYERALGALDSYDPEKGCVSTWICTIARNVTLNHLRTPDRNVPAHDALGPETEDEDGALVPYYDCPLGQELLGTAPSPEAILMAEETISQRYDRLTPRERQVANCMLDSGLSAKETARVLGIQPATVRVISMAVRRKLSD